MLDISACIIGGSSLLRFINSYNQEPESNRKFTG